MGGNALMDTRHMNGAAAEMFVASKLIELGYGVFLPVATQSRCDLIIETQDGFKKVQVKKATYHTNGTYTYLQARISGKNKLTSAPYTAKDVDLFAFTDMNRLWLVSFDEIGHLTSVCLDSSNPNYKPQTEYTASNWLIQI